MAVGAVALPGCASSGAGDGDGPALVVGVPDGAGTATSGPEVITAAPDERRPDAGVFVDGPGFDGRVGIEPPPSAALAAPDGKPWAAPLPFTADQAVPDGLVFVLVAGSDARPGEDMLKTRADSIHLLAVNPATGQGTLLGFPRDSWVEIPGRGRGKINNALALGGPDLLAATVRRLTGLPVDYYVITGFRGLVAMVDELGGVDVLVNRRMNDRASGARFQRGWHHFTGAEALAFARNRNDVEKGDLSRSENHGLIMLAGLAKMRAEVADEAGIAHWIGVLVRHAKLTVPLAKLPELGVVARRLDPARLTNVVAPGRIAMTAGQSVVFLTSEAAKMFKDLRDDAVLGLAEAEAGAEDDGTTSSTTTTSTRAPSSSSSSSSSSTTSSSARSSTTSSTGRSGSADDGSTTTTTDDSGTPVTVFPDG